MPAPYLPSPRTWTSGEVIKATYLRADVSGAVQLLSQVPVFSGYFAGVNGATSIPSATNTVMPMDTEWFDPWGGHVTSTPKNIAYYAQFPGWYLCEAQAGINYTGGAGRTQAGIEFTAAGGSPVIYGGPFVPNDTGFTSLTVAAAKLIEMTSYGTHDTATSDLVSAFTYQDSGSSQNLFEGSGLYPWLTVRWVAASSGTAGLALPANPGWVSPASYVTSSFMNTNVRDAIRFLTYPPVFEAYKTSNGSIPSHAALPTVGDTINLDTVTIDNYSAYDGTNTWTAPVAGTYYCYGQLAMTCASTTLSATAGLTITSSNYNSGTQFTYWPGGQATSASAITNIFAVRRRLRLNAGDTVLLGATQHDSGANNATTLGTGSNQCRLIIIWQNS